MSRVYIEGLRNNGGQGGRWYSNENITKNYNRNLKFKTFRLLRCTCSIWFLSVQKKNTTQFVRFLEFRWITFPGYNDSENPSIDWAALFYIYCFHFFSFIFLCGRCGRIIVLSELLLEILSCFCYSRSGWDQMEKLISASLQFLFNRVWELHLVFFLISLKLVSFRSLTIVTYYCYLFKEVSY